MPGFDYNGRRVGTKITANMDGPGAGIAQSFGFKVFGKYWKKFFEKRMLGKIYGPPKWKKPAPESGATAPAPKVAAAKTEAK